MLFPKSEGNTGVMKHDLSVHPSARPCGSFPKLLNIFRLNLYQNFYTLTFRVNIIFTYICAVGNVLHLQPKQETAF